MKDYRFLPYESDKPLELAPDIRKWLPPDHLGLLVSDVVDMLDTQGNNKGILPLSLQILWFIERSGGKLCRSIEESPTSSSIPAAGI